MKGCVSLLFGLIVWASLTAMALSIYCLIIIWALNFIFHLGINMWDLWAWLAVIILTGLIKAGK